nr:hypothetical protein [uncultured Sediminibacterium sp.]
MNDKPTIGILAYGSLINDPGEEINQHIIGMKDCVTPFNVEYARMSKTRANAPTLIPVRENGKPVNAKILLLNGLSIEQAEDMLWRRETRTKKINANYPRKEKPGTNDVVVKRVADFEGVPTVLYTSIGQNLGILNPTVLAKLAINSFIDDEQNKKTDGIHYLLNAKQNGIETGLSKEYEKAINELAGTKTLVEAIKKLAILRSEVWKERKEDKAFEAKVKEIGDLIHSYGLSKTSNGQEFKEGESFKAFIDKNRKEFMINVHEGFKKGQSLILELMLGFEKETSALEAEHKRLNGREGKELKKKIDQQIKRINFKEDLLRHMIDSIAWQLIQGQLYISRRLYHNVGGKKRLADTNIESVMKVAENLNKVPEDFALITDLSAYIQTGDIIWVSKGTLHFVEVKEGDKNHEVLKIMDEIVNTQKTMEEIFSQMKPDRHFVDQLDRNLKQFQTSQRVMDIINTDKGVDKQGREVKIFTPDEPTPRFDERLSKLEEQLKTRNLWAYDLIDDCLHIGIYNGPLKFVGPKILESIAKQHNSRHVIVNYRHVIRSLHRPIFSLPISPDLVYDILFGRVNVYFMIELDAYFKLFPEYGLKARWLSRKETAKLNDQHKNIELFIQDHHGILISDEGESLTMYLTVGMLGKMYFELIYPSYTAYSCLYHFHDKLERIQADKDK